MEKFVLISPKLFCKISHSPTTKLVQSDGRAREMMATSQRLNDSKPKLPFLVERESS